MNHVTELPSEPSSLVTEEDMQKGMPPLSAVKNTATLEAFTLEAGLL